MVTKIKLLVHALFAVKELAVKIIEEKIIPYVLSLDAIQPFDRLWRCALFYKVKIKINTDKLNILILFKIYYDSLQTKIKINNNLSKIIRLLRGVKQGGVLSGDQFNCLIDGLIDECCNSGLGAKYIDIVLSILGFCDDICLFSCCENDLRQLLMICEKYAQKWGIDFNISKCKFIVFGSNKYNEKIFLLNNKKKEYTDKFKYLGLILTPNLNMSQFFVEKFQKVKNSFYSLNAFGFKSNGVSPFLQSFIYKSFCISRILYGFEIMNINKKTLTTLNIEQNDLIRYMTGLSRHSHISSTLKILKLFNIFELYTYMKLIFVKNLKSNHICKTIFNHLLLCKHKSTSLSFMKEFKIICINLKLVPDFVINNISNILLNFKKKTLEINDSIDNEIITVCLQNNTDPTMRYQLNLVTYAGPQI